MVPIKGKEFNLVKVEKSVESSIEVVAEWYDTDQVLFEVGSDFLVHHVFVEPSRLECSKEEHRFNSDEHDTESGKNQRHHLHAVSSIILIIPLNLHLTHQSVFIESCGLFDNAIKEDHIIKAFLSSTKIPLQFGDVTLHLKVQCYKGIVAIVVLLVEVLLKHLGISIQK